MVCWDVFEACWCPGECSKKDQPAVEMFKAYWNSRSHWDVDWCFTFVSYRVLIHWLEKLAIQLLLQVYNPTGETVGILQKIMTSLWLLHLHLRTSNWLQRKFCASFDVQILEASSFYAWCIQLAVFFFGWDSTGWSKNHSWFVPLDVPVRDVPLEFRTCVCFSFQLGWKEIQGIFRY